MDRAGAVNLFRLCSSFGSTLCADLGYPASSVTSLTILCSQVAVSFGLGALQERCITFIEAHSQVHPLSLYLKVGWIPCHFSLP